MENTNMKQYLTSYLHLMIQKYTLILYEYLKQLWSAKVNQMRVHHLKYISFFYDSYRQNSFCFYVEGKLCARMYRYVKPKPRPLLCV